MQITHDDELRAGPPDEVETGAKSRPAEPEPNRLCRRCDLPFQQYVHHRTGNNTCRLCKNALQRAYKKAKRKQPDRPLPERAQPSMPVLRWLADQKVTP